MVAGSGCHVRNIFRNKTTTIIIPAATVGAAVADDDAGRCS